MQVGRGCHCRWGVGAGREVIWPVVAGRRGWRATGGGGERLAIVVVVENSCKKSADFAKTQDRKSVV